MEKQRKYSDSFIVSGLSPLEDKVGNDDLKTIGFKMSSEEVQKLIYVLKNALEKEDEWKYLYLTGYRKTNRITVSNYIPVN